MSIRWLVQAFEDKHLSTPAAAAHGELPKQASETDEQGRRRSWALSSTKHTKRMTKSIMVLPQNGNMENTKHWLPPLIEQPQLDGGALNEPLLDEMSLLDPRPAPRHSPSSHLSTDTSTSSGLYPPTTSSTKEQVVSQSPEPFSGITSQLPFHDEQQQQQQYHLLQQQQQYPQYQQEPEQQPPPADEEQQLHLSYLPDDYSRSRRAQTNVTPPTSAEISPLELEQYQATGEMGYGMSGWPNSHMVLPPSPPDTARQTPSPVGFAEALNQYPQDTTVAYHAAPVTNQAYQLAQGTDELYAAALGVYQPGVNGAYLPAQGMGSLPDQHVRLVNEEYPLVQTAHAEYNQPPPMTEEETYLPLQGTTDAFYTGTTAGGLYQPTSEMYQMAQGHDGEYQVAPARINEVHGHVQEAGETYQFTDESNQSTVGTEGGFIRAQPTSEDNQQVYMTNEVVQNDQNDTSSSVSSPPSSPPRSASMQLPTSAPVPDASQGSPARISSQSTNTSSSFNVTPKLPPPPPIKTTAPSPSPQPKVKRRSKRLGEKLNSTRWALSENAKDLFAVRLFSRVEVDEVLPKAKLEQIRGNTKPEDRWLSPQKPLPPRPRKATGSVDGIDSANRSPKPLPMDGIPSRASVTPSIPSLAETTHSQALVEGSSMSQPSPSDADRQGEASQLPDGELPVQPTKDLGPVTLPRKGAVSPSGRQLSTLPTIPEGRVTNSDNVFVSPTLEAPPKATEYIFLPSTSYSLINPTHRQGPIRLAKTDLSIESLTAAIDDTLDWTAFQMAILGGAGDLFGEAIDYGRLSDAELDELDELSDWLESFGIESLGRLVSTDERSGSLATPSPATSTSSPRSAAKASDDGIPRSSGSRRGASSRRSRGRHQKLQSGHGPSSAGDDGNVRTVHTGHDAAGSRRHGDSAPSKPSRFSERANNMLTIDSALSNKLISYSTKGHPESSRMSRDSVQSLPQSPMLDLVVSKDVEGNEYVVPMGFNLGHDLGDYLRWESENVYCAGYVAGA